MEVGRSFEDSLATSYGVSEVTLPSPRPSPKLLLDALFSRPSRYRSGLCWLAGACVPRLSVLAQQPAAGSIALGGTRPPDPDADQHHHESVSRSHHRTDRQ